MILRFDPAVDYIETTKTSKVKVILLPNSSTAFISSVRYPSYQCLPVTSTPISTHPSTSSFTLFRFQPSLTGMVSRACLPSKYTMHLSHADWESGPWRCRICVDMAERWREGRSEAWRGLGIRLGGCCCVVVAGTGGSVVWVLEVGEARWE